MKLSRMITLACVTATALLLTGAAEWTKPNPTINDYTKSLVTNTTGTGAVPTLATDGVSLESLKTYDVEVTAHVVPTADDAGYYIEGGDTGTTGSAANTLGQGCKLLAYMYNPVTFRWSAVPTANIDLSSASGGKQLVGLSRGIFAGMTPPSTVGRFALVPHANCTVPLKVLIIARL